MAPGQILIELVIPIVSVAATILGALVIKKRRDRRKAKACETIDMTANLDDHRNRIGALEHIAQTNESASRQYVEAQIQSAVNNLRAEIECVNERTPSKGEMERHVNDGCVNVLQRLNNETGKLRAEFATLIADATNSVRNDLESKMLDTAKKIGEDAESDVEIGMVDVRKEINKKLQEYDLAITKWVGKKMEDYQLTLRAAHATAYMEAFGATEHDVQAKVDGDMCDKCDDVDDEIGHDAEIEL